MSIICIAGQGARLSRLVASLAFAAALAACVAVPAGGGGGGGGGHDVAIIDTMLPAIGNEAKSVTLLATNKSVSGRAVQMKFLAGAEGTQIFVVQAGGSADDGRTAPLGDLWQRTAGALPANPERADEVAGIIVLDPARRYVLAVQSTEPRDANFQVAVMVVTREVR